MPCLLAHQLLAGSRQRAQFLPVFTGDEARLDQAMGGEIGDPHSVVHVRLAAGDRLDGARVGEHKLECARAQDLPYRKPIDAGRLHRRQAAPTRIQPLQQGREPFGRRLIRPTFSCRPVSRHRPQAGHHGVLVNVQAGDAIMDHVHCRLLLILRRQGRFLKREILKSRLRSVAAPCANRGRQNAPGPTRERACPLNEPPTSCRTPKQLPPNSPRLRTPFHPIAVGRRPVLNSR
jgi:hypothetical protein